MSNVSDDLPEAGTERFRVDDLLVDVGQQRVVRDGIDIALPNLSFRLLLALIRAAPNVLSNDELMERVWPGLIVSPETVSKRVKLLRDALGDDAQEPRYVVAIRSRGYRLVATVTAATRIAGSVEMPATLSSTPVVVPRVDRTSSGGPGRRLWSVLALAAIASLPIAVIALRMARHPQISSAEAPQARPFREPVSSETRSHTVAVMPFENLSAQAADAYLAQGLPEMIIDRLSQVIGLSVIARSSSFALPTKAVDSHEVGQRLNSGYLINGSVQREADRIRVAVQLVETASGTLVWSAHFDRDWRDIFNIEDEIAEQAAQALAARLGNLDTRPLALEHSLNPTAYLAYLQGRALLGRMSVAGSEAAVPQFERAIAVDPQFAAAYASLYDARLQAAAQRKEDLDPVRLKYRPLIDRALAINPESGAAYFARARWGTNETNAARDADFRHGLALDPSNGRGLTAYANFLIDSGHRDEGLNLLKRALWIDPMSPQAHFLSAVNNSLGGGTALIEQQMADVLELDPNFVPALQRYGKLRWLFEGESAQAVQILERAISIDPANARVRNTAMAVYLDLGDPVAARDVAAGAPTSAAAAQLLLSLYQGDWRRAGAVAASSAGWTFSEFENWGAGEALRDYALKTGELDQAIALLESGYGLKADSSDGLWLLNYRQAVFLSQLLAAKGSTEQAQKLRRAAMEWIDVNEAKYGSVYARRIRAANLLLDGKRDAALSELAQSFRANDYTQWWYTLKYDPLWLPLHDDPAFRAIVADVRRHVDAKRGELEALRRRGDVPRRGGPV
jgi:TolB-like protein/DNA-binding winged helix-turn-helix (wHTH) protein/Tfp pilus assembly protein PilF